MERSRASPRRVRPTIRDVAAAAGVSRSAAGRALSGSGYVGAEPRRRVLAAAAELGYVPHLSARHLKDRFGRFVGVLTADLRSPRDAALVAGVTAAAREHGFVTMVADVAGDPVDATAALRDFVALDVAGAVLAPVSAEAPEYLARYGIPVVEVFERLAVTDVGPSPEGAGGGGEVADGLPDPAAVGRAAVERLVGWLTERHGERPVPSGGAGL